MVNAQEWLDKNYPLEARKNIKDLNINIRSGKEVINGSLKLEGFSSLETLNCTGNKLVKLDITSCPNLKEVWCRNNQLTSLDLSNCSQLKIVECSFNKLKDLNLNNCLNIVSLYSGDNYLDDLSFLSSLSIEKLENLSVRSNNFSLSDLSIFSRFINLKNLRLENDNKEKVEKDIYNRFYGSLEPLKNLTRLELLDISDTDLDSGLEYLPASLLDFFCESEVENKRCQIIIEKLEKEKVEVNSPVWKRNWKAREAGEDWKGKKEKWEWKESTESAKKVSLLLPQLEEKIKVSAIPYESLGKMIEEKFEINKRRNMVIEFFSTWFNPNCAIVVVNRSPINYEVMIVIYEPAEKNLPEILKFISVSKHKNEKEAGDKVKEIKEKLNSDNPILATEKDNFSLSDVVERFDLYPEDKNIKDVPDNYLKPLDIVWVERSQYLIFFYHAAIYLGNRWIAHISTYSLLVSQLKEYQSKLNNETILREIHETDEWLKSKVERLQWEIDRLETKREKNIVQIERDDTKAQVSSWERLLKRIPKKLIRYHSVIPFKKPKQIAEHILRTIFAQYAKEQYNLFKKNCQHFATMCVYGIPFSEQTRWINFRAGKKNLAEEIGKSNKEFETVDLGAILERVRGRIWDNLKEAFRRVVWEKWKEKEIEGQKKQLIEVVFGKQELSENEFKEKFKKLTGAIALTGEVTEEDIDSIWQLYQENLEVEKQLKDLERDINSQQGEKVQQMLKQVESLRKKMEIVETQIEVIRLNKISINEEHKPQMEKTNEIKKDWFTTQRWLTDQEIDWATNQVHQEHLIQAQQLAQKKLRGENLWESWETKEGLENWIKKLEKGQSDFKLLPSHQFHYVREAGNTAEAQAYLAFSELVAELDANKYELVFIPVVQNEFHWSLLVYGTKSKTFYHYDTLNGTNYEYVKPLVKDILLAKEVSESEWERHLIPQHDIQQGNDYDCGVAILSFIKKIVKKYSGSSRSVQLGEFDLAEERKYWKEKLEEKESREVVQDLETKIEVLPNKYNN